MALPEASELVIAAVMMFVGATVLGTVGFGIGISTAPVLLLVLEPQTVVVTVNTVSLAVFVLIIRQTRGHLPGREMAPVIVAGLVGAPVGVLVLDSVSPTVLRIVIAALVVTLTIPAALGMRGPAARPRFTGVVVGFVVGALLTGSGIGGPLVALHLLSRRWSRQAIRASMAFYFLAVEATGVLGYAVTGLFTEERVGLILVVTGPVILGFVLATAIGRKMNERLFRTSVVVVVLATSVMVLGREALRLGG